MSRAAIAIAASAAFIAGVGVRAAQTQPAPGVDAKAIVAGVYQQDKSRDVTFHATLNVFDANGQETHKKFVLERIGSPGASRTLVRFTEPAEIKGLELLSINEPGTAAKQYLYAPAIDRMRTLTPREQSERFADSDFTYEDIGERSLDDFTCTLVSDTDVMDKHKTYKIELQPVTADKSQYKYIYVWIAQDVPVILHAQMYDAQGQLVRELGASDIKHESGVWGARRLQMSSPQEHTKTDLIFDSVKFDSGLRESAFTPEALGKAK
jgi:hypothetical protein